jgi:hypothetical protein
LREQRVELLGWQLAARGAMQVGPQLVMRPGVPEQVAQTGVDQAVVRAVEGFHAVVVHRVEQRLHVLHVHRSKRVPPFVEKDRESLVRLAALVDLVAP